MMKEVKVSKITNNIVFISQKHTNYNVNINIETINYLDDKHLSLNNIVQMQVADLKLAMQIYLNQKGNISKSPYIFTLDKGSKIAIEQYIKLEQNTKKDKSLESFNNAISIISSKQENLDINTLIIELASLLQEKDTDISIDKIKATFNKIKQNLESYNDKTLNLDNIKDCDFFDTKRAFDNAKDSIKEIIEQIKQYENMSKEEFENRFSKGAIILSISIFMTTHTPLLAHILVYKLGSSVAKRMLLSLCGGIIGPIGIVVSTILLLFEIMDFFVYRVQENKKITQSYRLYGAIISIYEKLEYSLASFLNLGHIGFGNLITTQNNNTLTYHLYPNYNEFTSTCVYNIIGKYILKDTQFKVSLSLQKEMIKNDKYLNNIFEINNIDSMNTDSIKHKSNSINTQFSTFSIDNMLLTNSNASKFIESSAFQHIKNIFLRFDSFLFVKTSSFTSLLANDILMQSFKTSNQHNPARINKTALFLTNCLHNGVSEYKVQQHIKNTLQNNDNIKNNVLFLSAMCRIEKSIFVQKLLNQMVELFSKLENYGSMNGVAQKHYLTQNIGLLISKYGIGRVSYFGLGKHIASYSLDDTLLNNLDVNKFCNFVSELCMIFITKKHANMIDEYNVLKLYQYGNDKKKYQEARLEMKNIFMQMNAIIDDISKILSHFNNFNLSNLKQYQKDIDKIYEQQKKDIEKYFKEKSNIFYNIDSIKDLCLEILSRYFYKDSNLESLYEKYKNIQLNQLEKDVKDSNKMEYENILETIIMPLLPLNNEMLNCLDENERLLFYEIIDRKSVV